MAALVDGHELLRVVTSDGAELFPASQFDDDGVIAGLAEVLPELRYVDDPWMVAGWLATRDPLLADRTPIDAPREGDTTVVLTVARDTAARWTH